MIKQLFLLSVVLTISVSVWAELPKRILMVSAEKLHVKKTGGLAEATAGLQAALNALGIPVDFMIPAYRQMEDQERHSLQKNFDVGLDYQNGRPQKVSRFSLSSDSGTFSKTYFLEHMNRLGEINYFDNSVNTSEKYPSSYTPNNIEGEAWGAWSKATAEFILSQNYDLVILNDWHTAAIAIFLDMAKKEGRKVPKVNMTIHNMAFQGEYPKDLIRFLGIPESYYQTGQGIEYHGRINFMKGALVFSDAITSVSEKYAQEITTTSDFGSGLEGVLREEKSKGKLVGILNGITQAEWNPSLSYHPEIKWTFSAEDFSGKAKGKAYLQQSMGLTVDAKAPVFISTSRIAEQKGFDYLVSALEVLVRTTSSQVLMIGNGDAKYMDPLYALAKKFPNRFSIGEFNKDLEKRFTAYGDFFINAARFEPSGLNQQFSQANGTIPIVSNTGGLSDSVKDGIDGLKFDLQKAQDGKIDVAATSAVLAKTLKSAANLYRTNPAQILKLKQAAIRVDNSWTKRVEQKYFGILNYIMESGPQKIQAKHLQSEVLSRTNLNIEQLTQLSGVGPFKIPPRLCRNIFE